MENTSSTSAYWLQKTHFLNNDEYVCSACKSKVDKPYKTCPSCGRIMKGKTKDSNWIDEMAFLEIMLGDDL